jgi:photosystem II stability/assembly factor-like uncharacterized protein
MLLSTLAIAQRASAQWTKLNDFPAQVRVVHFLDLAGPPRIGFVGLYNGQVWRTLDGGISWSRSKLDSTLSATATISNFTFKDSLVGWLSMKNTVAQNATRCFKTTDGGYTWMPLSPQGDMTSIYYNRTTGRLFLIDLNNGPTYSDDEGSTWNRIGIEQYIGIAFSNGKYGIISGIGGGSSTPYFVTSDGGSTWQTSTMQEECWQPAAKKGTPVFYVLSEYSNKFFRSGDGGFTFTQVYDFTGGPLKGPTGAIGVTDCGDIFAQTSDQGMLLSTTEGKSWTNIAGPSNIFDSRFAVAGDFVFAGDPLGGLWRYERVLVTSNTGNYAHVVLPSGNRIDAGNMLPVSIAMKDDLQADAPVDSIEFEITFDNDVLSRKAITAGAGWTLGTVSDISGLLDVVLHRVGQAVIPRDQPIVTFNLQGFVAVHDSTQVVLASTRFNGGPIAAVGCSILALNTPDSAALHVNYVCGDSQLRNSLVARPRVSIISISPNPSIGHGQLIEVTFDLEGDARVIVSLTDEMGHEVRQMFDSDLISGQHSVGVSSTNITSGVYYIVVVVGGHRVVRKIIVLK